MNLSTREDTTWKSLQRVCARLKWSEKVGKKRKSVTNTELKRRSDEEWMKKRRLIVCRVKVIEGRCVGGAGTRREREKDRHAL